MSIQTLTRHPALWVTASLLVGGLAFQAGRAAPPANMTAKSSPMMTRTASFTPESGAANAIAPSLRELDGQFANLVEQISPSVVHIRTSTGDGTQVGPTGQGSGVIIRPDGWIVTNDHVVNGASNVTVILSNGKEYTGRVIESDDNRNDIAMVKIEAKDLPTADFADSDQVRPGEYAIAVGAPFGLENTVTIGHISAIGRMNEAGNGQGESRAYSSMIQTDAPINPGNSGGPLLDIDGKIVGINTSIYSGMSMMGGGQSAGIGFAIPSNQVRFISDLLINNKKLKRGYLNVVMETLKPYEIQESGLAGGVRVGGVQPGGAAATAGIKKGDIITKIGSYTIDNDQDLLNAMLRYAPGEKVDIQVVRGGKPQSVSVKIDEQLVRPQASNRMPRQNSPDSGFQMPDMDDLNEMFGRNRPNAPSNPTPNQERTVGEPARLGVQFQEVDASSRKAYNIPEGVSGAVVMSVEPNSVAEEMGVRVGDLITKLGSTTIRTGSDLVNAVKSYKVGQDSSIEYSRFGANGTQRVSRTLRF